METVLSLALVVVIPAMLVYVLALLEPFAVTRRRVVFFSLAWGLVSFLVADVIQANALSAAKESGMGLVVTLYIAPTLEEVLKIAFLLVIYHYTLARYSGDGLVYGFAVGSGFAIAENIAYMLSQPDQALGIALLRSVTTTFYHASLAGIYGAVVCSVIFYRRWITYPIFAFLVVAAFITHHFYNLLGLGSEVLNDISDVIWISSFLLSVNFLLMIFIRFVEHRRIEHDIPEDLDPTERMVLRHSAQVLQDLDQAMSHLGPEQIHLLREYLVDEAHLAFLTRKAIKGHGHRPNIQKIRHEVTLLREKIRQVRLKLSPEAVNWLEEENKRLFTR